MIRHKLLNVTRLKPRFPHLVIAVPRSNTQSDQVVIQVTASSMRELNKGNKFARTSR